MVASLGEVMDVRLGEVMDVRLGETRLRVGHHGIMEATPDRQTSQPLLPGPHV